MQAVRAAFACRFFLKQADFEAESRLYNDAALRPLLPDLIETHDNSAGTVRSPSGWAYPSYIVLGRGVTLRQWATVPAQLWRGATTAPMAGQSAVRAQYLWNMRAVLLPVARRSLSPDNVKCAAAALLQAAGMHCIHAKTSSGCCLTVCALHSESTTCRCAL